MNSRHSIYALIALTLLVIVGVIMFFNGRAVYGTLTVLLSIGGGAIVLMFDIVRPVLKGQKRSHEQ